MNWKTFFGVELYSRMKEFCNQRNISIASVIRSAVADYLHWQTK